MVNTGVELFVTCVWNGYAFIVKYIHFYNISWKRACLKNRNQWIQCLRRLNMDLTTLIGMHIVGEIPYHCRITTMKWIRKISYSISRHNISWPNRENVFIANKTNTINVYSVVFHSISCWCVYISGSAKLPYDIRVWISNLIQRDPWNAIHYRCHNLSSA